MTTDPRSVPPAPAEEFDRGETGVRILIALLFFVIARLVEMLFALLAVFCLGWTLITRQRPSPTVQRFALRLVRYIVEIGRYLAYYDDDPPFPFRDLPPEPRLEAREGYAP
jgi:hypothetical protein